MGFASCVQDAHTDNRTEQDRLRNDKIYEATGSVAVMPKISKRKSTLALPSPASSSSLSLKESQSNPLNNSYCNLRFNYVCINLLVLRFSKLDVCYGLMKNHCPNILSKSL